MRSIVKNQNKYILLWLAFLIGAFSYSAESADKKGIAFISDIQAPNVFEDIFFKNESNVQATDVLLKDLNEKKPSSLFILGDIAAFGFQKDDWKFIDKHLKEFRRSNIPYYATPGNHEYIFYAKKGIKNFLKSFPNTPLTGYYKIVDSIAVVMLNSNFSKLKSKEQDYQLKWYRSIMDSLQKRNSVKTIIVCCHHAPFTNSKIVTPSTDVQQKFLPIFEKTSKAKIFLSGHSHNLEQFILKDKNYFVIGGGGGSKQVVSKTNKNQAKKISIKNKHRFFYILVNRKNDELVLTARGFSGEKKKMSDIEIARISIK